MPAPSSALAFALALLLEIGLPLMLLLLLWRVWPKADKTQAAPKEAPTRDPEQP